MFPLTTHQQNLLQKMENNDMTAETNRREFEEWAISKGYAVDTYKTEDVYWSKTTRAGWEAWQAARGRITAQRDRLAEEVGQLKSRLTQTQGCVTISRNGYVQELERELAEAREVLREIRDNEVNPEDEADKFLRDHAPSELSKVRDQRDRLAEALDELIITEGRGLDQWERDAFAKAKQAIAAVKGGEP